MKKQVSYEKKLEAGLKNYLTINDISTLLGVGKPYATSVRSDVLKYCKANKIYIVGDLVPKKALFKMLGWTMEEFIENIEIEKKSFS